MLIRKQLRVHLLFSTGDKYLTDRESLDYNVQVNGNLHCTLEEIITKSVIVSQPIKFDGPILKGRYLYSMFNKFTPE